MSLSADFKRVVESLPEGWTDLSFDLRIFDPEDYIDSAVLLSQINAQPYSRSKWHWRVNVANQFGHAAAAQTVAGILDRLDREAIAGEIRVRDSQEGRVEIVQMWGRPESVREEFRQRRSL